MTIGYIGLGAMGSALARQLIGKYDLVVWDLNSQAVAELVDLGAQSVSSAAEIAKQCEVIILCLPRSANVEQVVFGPGGLAEELTRGQIIIDHTSGIPAATFGFAERLAIMGVEMIDAPVAGGVPSALAGAITIMTSGSDSAHEHALPVLKAVSPKVYRCSGRVGDAQAIKLVNNTVNAGYRMGTLEIVALGRKLGLSFGSMISALQQGWAHNFTSKQLLPAIVEQRPSNTFALSLMVKDLNQALALGRDTGAPMPLAGVARGLMQIGGNTLGDSAQLDDLVALTGTLAGVDLTLADEVTPPQRPAPQETRRTRIGVAGLDGGLVNQLLRQHEVRRLDAGEALPQASVDQTIPQVTDLPTLLGESDLVMLDGQDVTTIIEAVAAGGIRADRKLLIADFTSRPFSESQQLANALQSHGVALVDLATVAEPGSPGSAADTWLCGGTAGASSRIRGLLEPLGYQLIQCGDAGQAQLARLIVNTIALCNRMVVYENAAMGVKLGLELHAMAQIINDGSGWSREADKVLPALASGLPTTNVPLSAMLRDIKWLIQAGTEAGAPMLMLYEMLTLLEACAHSVGAPATLDALAPLFEQRAGMTFKER